MKGNGASIYRHQSVFGPGMRGYTSTNYGSNHNNDHVFYDGDRKPVVKVRKHGGRWKGEIVGWKNVHKHWLKRNYIQASTPAFTNFDFNYSPPSPTSMGFSEGYGNSYGGYESSRVRTSVFNPFSSSYF